MDFRARCISPGAGDWRPRTFSYDSTLAERLLLEVTTHAGFKEFAMMSNGLNSLRIIKPDDLFEEEVLPGGRTRVLFNRFGAADGIWLRMGTAFVTPLNGKPVLVARAGHETLALRYSSTAVSIIAQTFEKKAVAPINVTVTGYFGAPTCQTDHYEHIKAECQKKGMRSDYQYRLAKDGEHAYEGHGDSRLRGQHNLGIIGIPSRG